MPPDSGGPLRFSSDQLAEIIDAAKALPIDRRSEFLEELAERLRGRRFNCGDVRRAALGALDQVRGR
jgi:hypothetical protein